MLLFEVINKTIYLISSEEENIFIDLFLGKINFKCLSHPLPQYITITTTLKYFYTFDIQQ